MQPVTVTVSAMDNLTGIESTQCRVNGGEWFTYNEPFTIAENGSHTVECYSTDGASTVEDLAATVSFTILQPVTNTPTYTPMNTDTATSTFTPAPTATMTDTPTLTPTDTTTPTSTNTLTFTPTDTPYAHTDGDPYGYANQYTISDLDAKPHSYPKRDSHSDGDHPFILCLCHWKRDSIPGN
jgi:hypothetical protein